MAIPKTNSHVPQAFPRIKESDGSAAYGPVREIFSSGSRSAVFRSWRGAGSSGAGVLSATVSWRKMFRYTWTMAAVFLLVVIPLGAGVWFLLGPKYTAVGKIRLRPVIPRMVYQTDENGLIPYYDYYATTQADLIRSPQIIQKALDQPAARETEWFRGIYEKTPTLLTDKFLEDLTVQYKPKTEIIEVSMTLDNPRDAAVLVNRLMDEYIRFEKNKTEQTRDVIYQKLTETYDVLQDEIENRQKAARKIRQEVAGGAKEKIQLLSAEEEAIRHKKELAETLRSRLDQKELERSMPGSIEVMAPAVIPPEPSEDRRKKLVLAVMLAGLAAGMGMGYVRTRTSQTIYEAEDISGLLDEPFLGRVPHVFPKKPLKVKESTEQAEAVRRMRTLLLTRLNGELGNVLSLTSSRYGTGKTTISILLAKSIAASGKKVLLVDANLEKPALTDYFGNPKTPGLTGLLTRSKDSNSIVKTDYPLLELLPAGTLQHKPSSDLFADGTLAGFLQQWKAQYDFILVDTPPILSAADGAVVSQLADATLLVIRQRYCRRKDIFDTLDFLDACEAPFLGLVYVS